MKFTKEMSIMEALQAHPQAREVFMRHGLGCIGCMGATMESIEAGARMHGIDVDALLADLNALELLVSTRPCAGWVHNAWGNRM